MSFITHHVEVDVNETIMSSVGEVISPSIIKINHEIEAELEIEDEVIYFRYSDVP